MPSTKASPPTAAAADNFCIVPLRNWMESEAEKITCRPEKITCHHDDDVNNDGNNNLRSVCSKGLIIRKATIAYGIVELLKQLDNDGGSTGDDKIIRIDNFMVCTSEENTRSWDDIRGVSMLSPAMSLKIEEPSYLSGLFGDDEKTEDGKIDQRIVGRCLEVEHTSSSPPPHQKLTQPAATTGAGNDALTGIDVLAAVAESSNRCHLLARLLYELFTNEPFSEDALSYREGEPAHKKAKSLHLALSRKKLMLLRAKGDFGGANNLPFSIPCIVRMQMMGIPASLCLMTQNLLECVLSGQGGRSDDAYESLEVVGEDLHLLLLDPDRFLFDNEAPTGDKMQLLYRRNKLYGRDEEETLITDAFCRVSRGKSEAFFIGGFSGSGKSMLVNSLRNSVNVVGGYVIRHKFDAMAEEKPLSGVISAFNQICQMIKDRHSPKDVLKIEKKLTDEFGMDMTLLERLLPNIGLLCPGLAIPGAQRRGDDILPMNQGQTSDTMNVRSVCFTLLRFVRAVSSPFHPIMLFLDDIQWADSTAFDVIHTILSDTMGSCVFFVGAYRSNEVDISHDMFNLIEKLEISNVHMTKVSLSGLNSHDLNTMISDALCLYPRICKSLSSIVYQKTKGNPFFVLEFMQSLLSRGLLQYNFHQKRWVWNEDMIRAEGITDNVLHLLALKMNGLSDDVQVLLKVMACCGTSTDESVIRCLSESTEYPGLQQDGLDKAVSDGFIEKDGEGSFKFAHDKVREAAYNLIPESEKKQFHYNLGKVLHSTFGDDDADNTVTLIASQINHGKEFFEEDKELSLEFSKLNMKAGKKALDGCDHKTAYWYLLTALSLLTLDHWESHYDFSLRLHSLLADAAYSSCQYEEADQKLQTIFEKARSLEDKLPSYLLQSQILQALGKTNDVYNMCASVLTQFGETIPESVSPEEAYNVTVETLRMYGKVYNNEWLGKSGQSDEVLLFTSKLYIAIVSASFLCKAIQTTSYLACKALKLCLRNRLCQFTPHILLRFASLMMRDNNAASMHNIAKNAWVLVERFDMKDHPAIVFDFYGRIAWRFHPFQVCIDHLRRAVETALSRGSNDMGFYCSIFVIVTSIHRGEKLTSVRKEIDYYLQIFDTHKSVVPRNYLLLFRETVSVMIDNEQAKSTEEDRFGDMNNPANKLREAVYFHRVIQCFWRGHKDRCRHYSEKCMPILGPKGQFNSCMLKFYSGLNALDNLKKKSCSNRSKENLNAALVAMRAASSSSGENFMNKLHLLEAEQQSLSTRYRHNAISMYNASISSAKKSGFIHEQGLACERAGFHCMREKDNAKALEYLKQARECYEEWGSRTKVEFIQKELDRFSTTTTTTATTTTTTKG